MRNPFKTAEELYGILQNTSFHPDYFVDFEYRGFNYKWYPAQLVHIKSVLDCEMIMNTLKDSAFII